MAVDRRRRANYLRQAGSKTGINDVLDGGDASIELNSTDVGYGGMAGVLIEPRKGTRIEVTYQSQVKLDFKGSAQNQ